MLRLLTSLDLGFYGIILIVIAVLLFLGCFMDPLSMMMLTIPFFMPLAKSAGIELVWFGIIILIMLEISFITPPFGLLLFVMRGLAPPRTTTRDIYFAVFPFLLLQMIVVAAIISFPEIVIWLPRIMTG